ncbi:MAG: anaerobic glycerol-3-phosphate dehydrogenase subunit GlpA [Desulfovibrionaceae bacterium]|nr:anaerobic glycerol-3-phosphate dehydrogenase subunit GlpA [Desulfovibrionaceae bacterium]
MKETTVVIIGGGATGAGILRDLSMRGVRAILLEQGGLAHGTSSRFHGLLHSGGRYAVGDNEAARECIEENTILRRVGRECVEETEGFFVLTPQDDPAYVDGWVEACDRAGIRAEQVDVAEARRLEPNLAPDILAVYRVPDACVDGFRLVWHNACSARRYGGELLTYHRVTGIEQQGGRIRGVTARNMISGEDVRIACDVVINAAGSWAGQVAQLAGLDVRVSPDRGTLIAFNHRFTSRVINRLHKSSDGDIFVPHGSITILGTTSSATDRPDSTTPTSAEVLRLLELGRPLFPHIGSYRILRAFAGTRPLYDAGGAGGRSASRGFHIVDHEEEGLAGMASIFGGKLTTYRLMAEKLCDHVCARLGVSAPCRTAEEPMLEPAPAGLLKRAAGLFPMQGAELAAHRLGASFGKVVEMMEEDRERQIICECEMVSRAEIEFVAGDPATHSLHDVRLRTRMGMGTCQGTFCSLRAIGALEECAAHLALSPTEDVRQFAQERWKGLRPALWGTQAREVMLSRAVYAATMNLDGAIHEQD